MNDNELQQVPTLDRYEQDLDDWEQTLNRIRSAVDYAETTGDPSGSISARKDIAGMLEEIENTRHFITVKRNAIRQIVVRQVTADVDALFDGTARLVALPEDLHLQHRDGPG